ncbi:MAG TPA: hypothetical protein VEA16_13850 [Vicinamibacterales bacterium]|nr:hypothetical protein [Vicinamibacterales bacterium]
MRILIAALLAAAALQPPPSLAVPDTATPILLDGRCEGDEWRNGSRTRLRDDMALLLQQNASQLLLCATLPPDSYGTMDLYVGSRTAPLPINLHASAQVGERQRTTTGWPEWTFGNQRDWYSPPVALSRATVVDGRAQLAFGAVEAREVVIEKRKFGNGPWRMMLELRALGTDKRGTLQYPPAASADDPATWAIVQVRP